MQTLVWGDRLVQLKSPRPWLKEYEVKIQVDCKSLSHFVHCEGIALVNTKGLHCCSEQVLQRRKCKKVRLAQGKISALEPAGLPVNCSSLARSSLARMN